MKIAKLISGIIALLAGFSPLLLSLIGVIAVLGMNEGSVFTELIGFLTAVGMFASGIFQIIAHKSYHPKFELRAIGLMVVLFVLALIYHKAWTDLWAQVGVPLLFAAILFGIEFNANRTKLA
ncbi:hypothetical protein [Lacticaseibacillus porcinae]|uniref:hypothetical protein n=1 Tax=Lacticaseibacillus porcinae TaxID=1123687 RepID=UPI000F77E1D1|nr:hypothetical protein [Lacticaseibacillus porcinae]